MTNLKNRLEKLENRFIPELPLCIIYYRENEETYEQRLQRFQEENGYDLPDHATVICYNRIDPTNSDWPKKTLSEAVKDHI